MNNIGELIKIYRKEKSISQLDLCLKIGWENPSTLSRIEKGIVIPNRNTIIKIADSLELNKEKLNILLKESGFLEMEPEIDDKYMKILLDSINEDMNELNYPVFVQLYVANVIYWNPITEYFFTGFIGNLDIKKQFLNTTMIDIVFNSKYGINQNIVNWNEFSKIVTENMYKMTLILPNDNQLNKMINLWCNKYEDFRNNLEEIKQKNDIKHMVYNLPFVYNHPTLGAIKFLITTSFLYSDKRFVVQQLNPATYEDGMKLEKLFKTFEIQQ